MYIKNFNAEPDLIVLITHFKRCGSLQKNTDNKLQTEQLVDMVLNSDRKKANSVGFDSINIVKFVEAALLHSFNGHFLVNHAREGIEFAKQYDKNDVETSQEVRTTARKSKKAVQDLHSRGILLKIFEEYINYQIILILNIHPSLNTTYNIHKNSSPS